jgi:hypothetical protein
MINRLLFSLALALFVCAFAFHPPVAFAQAGVIASTTSIFGSAWTFLVTYVPYIVTAAAAATAVLPQGKPGSVWDTIRTVINWAAFNWGNAKNVQLK